MQNDDFNNIFGNMFGGTKYSDKNCTSCPYSLLPAKIKSIKSKMLAIKKNALRANTKDEYHKIMIDGFSTIYKMF